MNKIAYLQFVLFLILFTSCQKKEITIESTPSLPETEVPDELPACLVERIKNEAEFCLDKVYRYNYFGDTVYLFINWCPEGWQQVYDKHCNPICSPSGGMNGNGDGKCPNFYKDATDRKLIWTRE